ncbi:MAG: indolepyruvate ferredoxin oxidoreductase subunit alpha [Pseudomonadota bacterium]|nr:indolepyruvate ferredoxin oxidoreductase subunit alpha [Pseudomonadota bacterium]
MERTFTKEVELLRRGDGEHFEGEGILAITKALLQAGVSYVGGYQGAPISHLMDVLTSDSKGLMAELGVHTEVCANEAAACAMLAASVNYPIRGAVTWKSTVGTNVASDALSNVASSGVMGGALIVLGEDYGEGSSIIQERSHAFAMKCSVWLVDPRVNHPRIVELVEKSFELSEASNTPVMMEFRIRACHVTGRFKTKNNKKPKYSMNDPIPEPDYNLDRIALPPSTYLQERMKVEKRFPAAIEFIRDNHLNEFFPGDCDDIGIICQGGLYNSVIRGLQQLSLADPFGNSRIPIYCMNVTYPMVPEEVSQFCAGKRAVCIVEEGFPDYLEQALNATLRKVDLNTTVVGKDVFPKAGEYQSEVMMNGLAKFVEGTAPKDIDLIPVTSATKAVADNKALAAELLGSPIPKRPPGFCTGCPERPVFSALKLVQRDPEIGKMHISADIGCHTFSTLPPFNMGNTVTGYGLGLASSAGVKDTMKGHTISIMGDGGFWHNGLATGIAGAVYNKHDNLLIVMANGYSSATGQQHLPSTTAGGLRPPDTVVPIESALKGVGVKWIKKQYTYQVGKMRNLIKEALTSGEKGLKVIIAEAECQIAKQRREKQVVSKMLKSGKRVIRTRFGVDEDTCTGDHSCIRLSGCPSLSVKPNPDPLRKDPVASVLNSCVGCGLCGEVSDAAVLCPSFYQAEIIQNPGLLDRVLHRFRTAVIGMLQGGTEALTDKSGSEIMPEDNRIAAE